MHAWEVLHGKNISMVTSGSFGESSFVAVIQQNGDVHLGKLMSH